MNAQQRLNKRVIIYRSIDIILIGGVAMIVAAGIYAICFGITGAFYYMSL